MPWKGVVEEILKAKPVVVTEKDEETKLMPFMIAAIGKDSILDNIFSILISHPCVYYD